MNNEPQLQHQTVKVRQLVEDYRFGRIVIPEFQRDYVWKPRQAPLLVDSLYRGFPVSSLLLWHSHEDSRARRQDPRPNRSSQIGWLIDGQQRVITLTRTMNGDQGIEVVFNPLDEEFQLANAATRKDRNWLRVADIWDDECYRRLRRNLDGSRGAERVETNLERVRRILDYEIPMVKMIDHQFDDAVKAFTRINTLGVRLKREDIESARVAAKHEGFIADEVIPFLAKLRQQGFNRINIMHLFRACVFVAKPDGRNRTPLHELDKREVLLAWKETQRATDQAIGILRSELGLVNMNILWSGALIVPLIALCHVTSPRNRDVRGWIAWLALAALLHRYSSSAETALDQDLRACRSSDPLGALLSNLRDVRSRLTAEPRDFSGALNDRSGLLALYIACLHRGVLDFFDGSKILLQDAVDRHHILPRAQFDETERVRADNVANIAFVVGDVNRSIGASAPDIYMKKLKANVLASQCVPSDSKLWSIDSADDFWEARRIMLADSFNEFLRDALPDRRSIGR